MRLRGPLRQSEAERRTLTRPLRLDPDATAMHFDDSIDQRQPNPGSHRCGIQLLEQPKHFLVILRIDADTIVLNVEHGLAALCAHPKRDMRPWLIAHELGGVVE